MVFLCLKYYRNNKIFEHEVLQGKLIPYESEISNELDKSADASYQLVELLSKIHAQKFYYFGNISGKGKPLSEFPRNFKATLKKLGSSNKALQDVEIQRMLPYFLKQAEELPIPKSTGLI